MFILKCSSSTKSLCKGSGGLFKGAKTTLPPEQQIPPLSWLNNLAPHLEQILDMVEILKRSKVRTSSTDLRPQKGWIGCGGMRGTWMVGFRRRIIPEIAFSKVAKLKFDICNQGVCLFSFSIYTPSNGGKEQKSLLATSLLATSVLVVEITKKNFF